MKARTLSILILLAAMSYQGFAGDATNKLLVRMRNERSQLVESVVQSWLKGSKKDSVSVLIARLVDVDARLSVFNAEAGADSVLSNVQVKGAKRPHELAGAIAREYFRRKGLRVDTRNSFTGIYMLYPQGRR